jgi:hypothetical protein
MLLVPLLKKVLGSNTCQEHGGTFWRHLMVLTPQLCRQCAMLVLLQHLQTAQAASTLWLFSHW